MKDSLYNNCMRCYERGFLTAALVRHNWNRKAVAQFLGMSYRNLLYRIEKLGLTPPAKSA